MIQQNPLATLGLVGAVRTAIGEADRSWLRMATDGDGEAFDSLDAVGRGLLVAWRRDGRAMESAERGCSASGQQHVLIVGRIDAPDTSADGLAEVLEREGEEKLRLSAGPAIVLSWSDRDRVHTLFRPDCGQRVLCYAPVSNGLLFASDARTLARHPEVDGETNWAAAADHLAFGHLFGEKTLFRGIRRLGSGEMLTIGDGGFRLWAANWQTERLSGSRSSLIDRLDEALHEAVDTAWSGAKHPALCLSAGLDSRTLLAVAHRRGIPLVCVTNGIEGSVELRLARRMCEKLGAEHLSGLLEEHVVDHLLSSAQDVIAYTDGESTIQSANMLYVTRKYRSELGLDRVIRGIGGELLKLSLAYGYSLPPELAASEDESAVQEQLLGQLLRNPSQAEEGALSGELREILVGDPLLGFKAAWNALESIQADAVDKVSLFFLRTYLARATVDSMRVLRQSVDLTQPFLDERFIRTLFSLPSELRLDRSLQIELIRRNSPELLQIPDSNLRAPLEAGRLHHWVAQSIQRVGRRLGFFQIDVPEKWLVARLDDFFRSMLLEDRSLGRPHIDPDGMRRLLARNEAERAQARLFLARLATLELHFRSLESEVSQP